MSKRTVILTICDKCEKELTGRLTYRTCPCCGKDVCLACIDKEGAKHKPRERKEKAESTTIDVTVPIPEGTPTILIEDLPIEKRMAADNLTIHVPTEEKGDHNYRVNIAGSEATGPLLRETVMEALKPFDFKIPDCLSDEERQQIQGILDAGTKGANDA